MQPRWNEISQPIITDRIIIVDDDGLSAEVTGARLQLAGFTHIDTFTDPRQALADCEAERTTPAVVIADYHMPYMNGVELLELIEVHHPYISGIILTGDASVQGRAERFPVLVKCCFSQEELVRSVLDGFFSHLHPLAMACPAFEEKSDCPFGAIHQSTTDEKLQWLFGLQPLAAQEMLRFHQECFVCQKEAVMAQITR
jgi:CheY-like chemotaxis protein